MAYVYIGGDMLYKGSQVLRKEEREWVGEVGHFAYNPQDNKDINDKSNCDNEGLAERIVQADTQALIESEICLMEYQRFAEGTIAELGQLKGMKDLANMVLDIVEAEELSDIGKVNTILDMCKDITNKKIICHCDDVRRTNVPEVGDRRSFYINAYIYGLVLDLTEGKGFIERDSIKEELEKIEVGEEEQYDIL